jgi:hypothetical protein
LIIFWARTFQRPTSYPTATPHEKLIRLNIGASKQRIDVSPNNESDISNKQMTTATGLMRASSQSIVAKFRAGKKERSHGTAQKIGQV